MNWLRIAFASAFAAATIWAGLSGSMMGQLKDLSLALPADYDGFLATLPWRINTIVLALSVTALTVIALQFRDPFPSLAGILAVTLAFTHYPAGELRFDSLWLKVGPAPVDRLTALQQASSIAPVAVLVAWIGSEGSQGVLARLNEKGVEADQVARLRRAAVTQVAVATIIAAAAGVALINAIPAAADSAWVDRIGGLSGRLGFGILAAALLLGGALLAVRMGAAPAGTQEGEGSQAAGSAAPDDAGSPDRRPEAAGRDAEDGRPRS